MNLDNELKKAIQELEKAQADYERLGLEVRRLSGRVQALKFLKEQMDNPDAAGEFVPVLPLAPHQLSMTAQIKRIFQANPKTAFRTLDLIEGLKDAGRVMGPSATPTVQSTANRLVKEGFLKITQKDGYVAFLLK